MRATPNGRTDADGRAPKIALSPPRFLADSSLMCGRYVRKSGEIVFSYFEINQTRIAWNPSFNVAPCTRIPVIRRTPDGARELSELTWNLRPFWAAPEAKLPLMINARAETIATKPAYRAAFRERRCLVPASGYYEWHKLPSGARQPYYFEAADGMPLALGAIWDGETVATITTTPNAECAAIHDRMPVIVEKSSWDLFLAPGPLADPAQFLRPAPDGLLRCWPVDPRVGSVRNNDPALTDPLPAADRLPKPPSRGSAVQPDLFS